MAIHPIFLFLAANGFVIAIVEMQDLRGKARLQGWPFLNTDTTDRGSKIAYAVATTIFGIMGLIFAFVP